MPEINFSELSNKPVEAVRKVYESPTRSVRVHRRGGEEDLVLVTASRADEVREVVSTTTALFVALVQSDTGARELISGVMPKAFPWVRFLPKEDLSAFVVELIETLEAAESLGNPAPVLQVITEWRHTAEVHADPELLAILRRDGEDFGEIQEPEATTT